MTRLMGAKIKDCPQVLGVLPTPGGSPPAHLEEVQSLGPHFSWPTQGDRTQRSSTPVSQFPICVSCYDCTGVPAAAKEKAWKHTWGLGRSNPSFKPTNLSASPSGLVLGPLAIQSLCWITQDSLPLSFPLFSPYVPRRHSSSLWSSSGFYSACLSRGISPLQFIPPPSKLWEGVGCSLGRLERGSGLSCLHCD